MLTILRNFQRSFVKRFAFQNFFQKRNKNTKRTQMRRANVIFCVPTRFWDRQTLRNSTASMNLRDGRGNVDETRFRQSYPQSYPPLYRRPAAAPKTRGETNLIHPCRKLGPFPCCCVRCCCAVLCACVRARVRVRACVRPDRCFCACVAVRACVPLLQLLPPPSLRNVAGAPRAATAPCSRGSTVLRPLPGGDPFWYWFGCRFEPGWRGPGCVCVPFAKPIIASTEKNVIFVDKKLTISRGGS